MLMPIDVDRFLSGTQQGRLTLNWANKDTIFKRILENKGK